MTIIDLHSHWGTRRGYPLQTEKVFHENAERFLTSVGVSWTSD